MPFGFDDNNSLMIKIGLDTGSLPKDIKDVQNQLKNMGVNITQTLAKSNADYNRTLSQVTKTQ